MHKRRQEEELSPSDRCSSEWEHAGLEGIEDDKNGRRRKNRGRLDKMAATILLRAPGSIVEAHLAASRGQTVKRIGRHQ